jgi:hypothetical protein
MGIRRVLLALLAVPAILLGLLAMHALGGAGGHEGGHAMPVAHAAGEAAAPAHAALGEASAPAAFGEASAPAAFGADAAATGPGDGGIAALICILALLAVLLLGAAAAPLRLPGAMRLVAVARRLASDGRRPAPSLLQLSISRT